MNSNKSLSLFSPIISTLSIENGQHCTRTNVSASVPCRWLHSDSSGTSKASSKSPGSHSMRTKSTSAAMVKGVAQQEEEQLLSYLSAHAMGASAAEMEEEEDIEEWQRMRRRRHPLLDVVDEMSLEELSTNAQALYAYYDKILLLIEHSSNDEEPFESLLSKREIGQSLTMARKAATYLDRRVVEPELILCSPLYKSIQTLNIIFKYSTPVSSVRLNRPRWVCLQDLVNRPTNTATAESYDDWLVQFKKTFPGMDYYPSLTTITDYDTHIFHHSATKSKNHHNETTRTASTAPQLHQFLNWISNQEQRVVAVSTQSDLLQEFCDQTLECKNPGKHGSIRTVGIKFKK